MKILKIKVKALPIYYDGTTLMLHKYGTPLTISSPVLFKIENYLRHYLT